MKQIKIKIKIEDGKVFFYHDAPVDIRIDVNEQIGITPKVLTEIVNLESKVDEAE